MVLLWVSAGGAGSGCADCFLVRLSVSADFYSLSPTQRERERDPPGPGPTNPSLDWGDILSEIIMRDDWTDSTIFIFSYNKNWTSFLLRFQFILNWSHPRCSEESEAGTHFSSILCPGCRAACPPLRSPPADWSWQCPSCGRQTARSQVEAMMMRLDSELDSLRDNPSPVEELEVLLERFQHSSGVPLSWFRNYVQVQQCFPSSTL